VYVPFKWLRGIRKGLFYLAVFVLTGLGVWVAYLWKSGPDVTILMYHSVGPDFADVPGLGMTRRAFARHLDFFRRHGYRVLRFTDFIEDLKAGRRPGPKTIVLTFDDGYEDNHTNVFPLLKEYGFPATVFIITDLIGRRAEMYGRTVPFLSVAMLREMAASGLIDLGAHSATHAYLPDLDDDPQALAREVEAPRRFLEGLLGRPARVFSYPVGGHSAAVRRRVREAGYEAAVTTTPQKGYIHDDLFALKRVKMKGDEGAAELFFKTSGFYLKMKEMSR
jgi:peptidoglycan/xylan/chitin deacetylase (PgdA/CDA1 family)